MSGGVTYLTMDYSDMCFQNNNWQFSSSKSQKVLPSWFHISLTCNTRNRKISRSEAGMSNMPCGGVIRLAMACVQDNKRFDVPGLSELNSHRLISLLEWSHLLMLFFLPPSQRRPKMFNEKSVLVKIKYTVHFMAFKVCGI